jgi:hypothetical protein
LLPARMVRRGEPRQGHERFVSARMDPHQLKFFFNKKVDD